MIYLSGVIRPAADERLGFMLTHKMGQMPPPDRWWAADNGCFPRGDFDFDSWDKWLRRCLDRASERCLFVVAPDVPFNAAGTLGRFAEYRERCAGYEKPLAMCTQDGMGVEDVPWAEVQALMVGGSTAWKTGHESQAIVTEATRRGLWVHIGRVNSLRRMTVAISMGADSCDGTFLKFAPDINEPRLARWLDAIEVSRPMVLTLPP